MFLSAKVLTNRKLYGRNGIGVYMNKYIENLKIKSPLIHNITNMVTINDVANIELACGARPIMAMAPQEMEEVTGICDGLNINIGTPTEERFTAMRIAARTAQKRGIPITLDLVGVGVSRFRMNFVQELLSETKIDVIKGNLSEIKAIMEHGRCEGGVEAVDKADENEIKKLVCAAADRYNCVAVITGRVDYIAVVSKTTDSCNLAEESQYLGKFRVAAVTGGHPMMKKVTGTGCQLSGLICSFTAANTDDKFGAVKAALQCMKRAGEIAADNSCITDKDKAVQMDDGNSIIGNATYKNRIIDAVYQNNHIRQEKI